MIEKIKADAKERMLKSVEALRQSLTRLRTGRAHTSLLDHITVSYYGNEVPLSQVGSVNVADARTLTVQPWEKKLVGDIEKAIRSSDLGLNPTNTGDVIRIPLPPLTEERRRDLTKVVRNEAEQARVAVRNIRRDANQHLKAMIKDGSLAKDEEKRAEDEIQKLTNSHIEMIDGVLKEKEADLLEM